MSAPKKREKKKAVEDALPDGPSAKKARADVAETAKPSTRGSTCRDSEAIARAMKPFASVPIFIPAPPTNGKKFGTPALEMKKMWQDLNEIWPSLSFHKPSVAKGLSLLREQQVEEKIWHRDLTDLEIVEYNEKNLTRFLTWAGKIAQAKRKRGTVGWLQELFGAAAPKSTSSNCTVAEDKDKDDADVAAPSKFDWSTKRAQRMNGGVVEYAPFDLFKVVGETVVVTWPGDLEPVVVEDVSPDDLKTLKASIPTPKGRPLYDEKFEGKSLKVRSEKGGQLFVIRWGDRQLCQMVATNVGGAAVAGQMMVDLAKDVCAGEIKMDDAKAEKNRRVSLKQPAETETKVEKDASSSKQPAAEKKTRAKKEKKVEENVVPPTPPSVKEPEKANSDGEAGAEECEVTEEACEEEQAESEEAVSVSEESEPEAWIKLVFGR